MSLRLLRVYFLLFFLCVFTHGAFSQSELEKLAIKPRVFPPSPTAAAFAKYVDMPVSHYTGVPQIQIPLFTISEKDLSVNIGLSYHAGGLKVGDNASWVGTGWSLNQGGMITRTVRGRPDEQGSGYLENTSKIKTLYDLYSAGDYDFANADNSQYFRLFSEGSIDGDPDVFTYSCGSYSGKFYLVKDGTQVKVLTVPYQKLKFDIVNEGGTLSGFKITTPDGVRYEYLESESSSADNTSGETNYRSAWVLTKIVSPHGYSIGFEYDSHNISYPFSSSESLTIGLRAVGSPCSYSADKRISISYMSVNTKKLRKITSSNGHLLFTSSDGRTDINDKKLDRVELFDVGGTVVKSMKLGYEYFACVGGGTRLKLKSVTESDKDNCNLPSTVFTYNELNVPKVNSVGQDHWGFYNGKDNNPTMVPTITVLENSTTYPGGDREPAAAFMQGGILTSITYPTGGSTSFEYEPHYASNDGTAQIVGGLRIRKIKFLDPVVSKTHEKWYSYPEGNLLFKPEYKRIVRSVTRPVATQDYEIQCSFIQLTSTAMNVQGTEHVSYTKVEETDDQNGTQGKSVYYYSSESNYGIYTHRYPWVPGDERSKPNGLLLKTEQYNAQGTLVAYEYNEYNDPLAEPLHYESHRALKVGDKYIDNYISLPNDEGYRYNYYTQRYLFVFYYINSRWSRLDKKTVFKDGQTTTMTYSYDPELTFVRSETMKNSKELSEVKEYKYSADKTTAPYNSMVAKYMLNNVVEEKETVGSTLARTVTTEYGDFGGRYLVQKVKSKIGTGTEYEDIVISSYDDRGNPLQYTEKNGITTKMDWHSSLGKLDLIQNRIVGFGGSQPQKTIYDYKPLVGISLQTDPSNRSQYYNYDTFGRLLDVRENSSNGNLLQSYTYKFGSAAGCTTSGDAITTTPNVSVPATPGLIGETTNGSTCGAVTKVRFRWRGNDDNTRLIGAKIQGSDNGSTWTDLRVISDEGINDWMIYAFSNSIVYKHIRFVSGPNGYGELRELEFYSGDVKLSGTTFGSSPNFASNPWQNAFDGDAGSMWHGTNKGATNFVGLTLGCATTCVRPDIYKTAGTAVCSSPNQTVTLLASGCPGNVIWYRNGVQLSATTSTLTTNEAGTYTAKCSSGSCSSDASSGLVITQASGCDPTNGNQCTANLVKLLWRNLDGNRLAGATIQGSQNGVDWEVLYQFPTTAVAPVGSFVPQSFNNPNKYPHIRYNARANDGVGDLKEIRFYYRDANGTDYPLSGTGFGSEPNLAGQGWANALDGNESTQWHAQYVTPLGHPGNSNFVGISLPCATTLITPILYKSTSGDVCVNGSPITLTASGFSGELEWYLNDVLITNAEQDKTKFIATIAGTYKVRSKSVSSYSGFSNTIVLNQKTDCAPLNYSRVVIIGNSITKLIAQGGSDGWQSPALIAAGGWGRASSTQAKDFAHILESRFKGLNANAQVLPLWEAPFERDYINGSPAGWVTYNFTALQNRIANSFGSSSWKPDLVIIRLGENVVNSEVELNNFKGGYNTLINKVLEVSAPGAKVILTNSMWADQPTANTKIQQVATERGLSFVDLSDMISNPVYLAGNDPVSMAAFPNNTGDKHPGDAGMLEIAERIWSKVRNVDLPSNIGGNITKVRLSPRTECCIERITGSVIQGSNDISNANGWTTLVEIKDTLAAGWNEYPIRTSTAWRYVRFLAGPNCFGELKELEFYNGNIKLTGSKFGSSAAYNNDPTNYGYGVVFDGQVTNSWHGTSPGPQNYAGLDLGGCSSVTASVISPANNASVVGTRSTTIPGRVMIPISVRTCAPAGTTITGVEIWAKTTSGAWDSRMGYAIADANEAGVYKLSAEEATTPGTLGKWVSPIPIDPGTYRFYAKVYVGTTLYKSDSLNVTLTAPPATSNITKVRLYPRTETCCVSRIAGSVIQGSNDISNANGWTTLATISAPVAGWNEYSFQTTTNWRYVRFLADSDCYGDIQELEFYNGSVKLSGSSFGSSTAFNNDPANYGYAVVFDGQAGQSAKVWSGTAAGPQNYAGLDLGGCSSVTASVISPANNASVVGTRSTTNPDRVMIPISVRTCAPAGTTITGVEIWATTTSGGWDSRMGFAIADASQAGVYKLSAEEGSSSGTPGKWVSPPPLDPGTYHFYAKVYTGPTTFYLTGPIAITMTAP
jgi:hypothetical protein